MPNTPFRLFTICQQTKQACQHDFLQARCWKIRLPMRSLRQLAPSRQAHPFPVPRLSFPDCLLAGSSVGGANESLVCILPGPATRTCLFAQFRLSCLVHKIMTSAEILHDRGPVARIEQAAPIQNMLKANPRNLLMESCCLFPVSPASRSSYRLPEELDWTGSPG